MDKTVYLINLFDYYENLFTEKQKKYFKDYYFDNLSLSEISESMKVSRNAIHKTLKDIENKLLFYEDALKDYEKSIKIRDLIKDLDENLKNKIEEIL